MRMEPSMQIRLGALPLFVDEAAGGEAVETICLSDAMRLTPRQVVDPTSSAPAKPEPPAGARDKARPR